MHSTRRQRSPRITGGAVHAARPGDIGTAGRWTYAVGGGNAALTVALGESTDTRGLGVAVWATASPESVVLPDRRRAEKLLIQSGTIGSSARDLRTPQRSLARPSTTARPW